MGYEVTERIVVIRLRGTEFEGLEVRATVPPAGVMAAAMAKGDRGLTEELGKHLVQWDLTSRGEPITADLEGILSLPSDLAYSLAHGWWSACCRIQRDRPTRPVDESLNGAAAGTMIDSL